VRAGGGSLLAGDAAADGVQFQPNFLSRLNGATHCFSYE
jgi:hypothetical protein